MLTKRIIPCLDVMEGRVVKGMNFVNLVDAGDPVVNAKAYEKLDQRAGGEQQEILPEGLGQRARPAHVIDESPLAIQGLGVQRGQRIEQVIEIGVAHFFHAQVGGGRHHDVVIPAVAAALHLVGRGQQLDVDLEARSPEAGGHLAQIAVGLQDGARHRGIQGERPWDRGNLDAVA